MKRFIFTYFPEFRGPPTISALQASKVTAATWQWYGAMDAALRARHCFSQPLLIVTNGTSTADEVVSTMVPAPSVEEDTKGEGKILNTGRPSFGNLVCQNAHHLSQQQQQQWWKVQRKSHNCI